MLRVYLALLGRRRSTGTPWAARWDNPADPYMTLLGYFNSLKELGNARRIVEDEVVSRVRGLRPARRLGDDPGHFADRALNYEVEELTSRESTVKVAQTKAALALAHDHKPTDGDLKPVDVALATNMISVGLDITRLGLMVVCGQPKAHGGVHPGHQPRGARPRPPRPRRDAAQHPPPPRPLALRALRGLPRGVLPRVEATSVTPFSPRALDRGLAAVTVALARHGWDALTPADAVSASSPCAAARRRRARPRRPRAAPRHGGGARARRRAREGRARRLGEAW
jgi:hypothetical protein